MFRYLAGQKEYEVELQFTNQTSELLHKGVMLTEKPEIDVKEHSPAAMKEQISEKQLPPSIVASTISVRSKPPPPYSVAVYDNEGYVDDAVPGPSNIENLTIDVPAMPQRKVCFD